MDNNSIDRAKINSGKMPALSLKELYVGSDIFSKIRDPEQDYLYVDKTLLLREFVNASSNNPSVGSSSLVSKNGASEVELILRPRRFGKTMVMTMVEEFLSNRRGLAIGRGNLFEGLAINEEESFCKRHQNQYPVIFLTLKDIKTTDFNIFLKKVLSLLGSNVAYYSEAIKVALTVPAKIIEGISLSHAELRKLLAISEETQPLDELEESLYLFSKFLYFYYDKKVYILIDEYDTPVNYAYESYIENKKMRKEGKLVDVIADDFPIKVNNFARRWLAKALKTNEYLEKGLMTGIYPMTQRGSGSDLNNVKVYTLLDKKYSQYFGFTEAEVSQMIKETGKQADRELLSNWYNGYQAITREGEKIRLYNPWSMVNCLGSGEFKPYWEETGSHKFISNFIQFNEGFRRDIKKIIDRVDLKIRIAKHINYEDLFNYNDGFVDSDHGIWSILFYLGYITLDDRHLGEILTSSTNRYYIRSPNFEIKDLYVDLLRRYFFKPIIASKANALFNALFNGEAKGFAKALNDIVMGFSSLDFNSERDCQLFMHVFLQFLEQNYIIDNNKERGLGRPDHCLVPSDKQNPIAWALEYKYVGNLDEDKKKREGYVLIGLDQIAKKHYIYGLEAQEHIRKVIRLGIVFWKKTALVGAQHIDLRENVIDQPRKVTLYECEEDTRALIERDLSSNAVTDNRRKREREESEEYTQGIFSKPKRSKGQAQEVDTAEEAANEAENTESQIKTRSYSRKK